MIICDIQPIKLIHISNLCGKSEQFCLIIITNKQTSFQTTTDFYVHLLGKDNYSFVQEKSTLDNHIPTIPAM